MMQSPFFWLVWADANGNRTVRASCGEAPGRVAERETVKE